MKITRGKLTEMIEQEVRSCIVGLTEADDDDSAKKKVDKTAADNEPVRSDDPADGGGVEPIASSPPIGPTGEEENEIGSGVEPEDPTDGEGPDDAEAIDAEGESGEEPSGAVNDELSGKTVQAITIEPKSKVLPGAKEIVLTFNETTDAMRILVTATGQVKFFWRGQLHDIP